jgi:hypothetical protein
MQKALSVALTALALTATAPAALAVPGAGFSLGEGALFGTGDTTRTHVNGEAMLFMSLALVSVDLGLLLDMEQPDSAMMLRPGVRLYVPKLFYLRAAVPVEMSDSGSYGLLAGIGKSIVDLQVVRVFGELDATFMEAANYTDVVPVEIRVGVEIGF